MAQTVLGVGASHTTLMNTRWDDVDHLPRAHRFRDSLLQARERLHAARPDVVVILGSNHFRGFWLDLMPAFTMGVGAIHSNGEHGTPAGELPDDRDFALELCRIMVEQGVDMAFSDRITVDHGISHAFQWVIGEDRPIPIVPIVVNCFAPPLPSLGRCVDVGAILARAIAEVGGDKRVAIIATGGLSHALPFPDWRAPVGDDEEFLARSWSVGRNEGKEFEVRRREIIVAAPPRTNPAFDEDFLARLEAGSLAGFASAIAQDELVARAGNGGNEVRAWLMLAAAMGEHPGQVLAYSDMPEWLTGMAVAVIDPTN